MNEKKETVEIANKIFVKKIKSLKHNEFYYEILKFRQEFIKEFKEEIK